MFSFSFFSHNCFSFSNLSSLSYYVCFTSTPMTYQFSSLYFLFSLPFSPPPFPPSHCSLVLLYFPALSLYLYPSNIVLWSWQNLFFFFPLFLSPSSLCRKNLFVCWTRYKKKFVANCFFLSFFLSYFMDFFYIFWLDVPVCERLIYSSTLSLSLSMTEIECNFYWSLLLQCVFALLYKGQISGSFQGCFWLVHCVLHLTT